MAWAVAPAIVAIVSGLLLFWKLDARYLWQDEAACAVLAQRFMETGRPLSYDGTNLITMDEFDKEDAATIGARTGSAEAAVDYFVDHGDFKTDTSWIGQPWGQFVAAGLSLELLGATTFAARLPFALAAVATLVLLFAFVRRRFDDPWMAALAVAACLGSLYWFLHVRQCRYYALSSLFLLLTVVTYVRWQDGVRYGALVFVAVAWAYFHCDFGSFWPVMGVLFLDAVIAGRRDWKRPVAVFAAVGLFVLPFVFFYELFGRLKETGYDWQDKYAMTIALVNRYQLCLAVLPVFAWLVWRASRGGALASVRVPLLCAGIVVAQLAWMPGVSPYWFYRYVVDLTPLSALLTAFVAVRAIEALPGLVPCSAGARSVATLVVAVLVLTPWPARVVEAVIPVQERYARLLPARGTWLRAELAVFRMELRGRAPDPNRAIVELLRPRLEPGDEILVNYEDIPLMFYLPGHPIRGGIPAFRVEDRTSAPRFAVLRQSVTVTHWDVYTREFERHRWRQLDVQAPDVTWGNSPDPLGHWTIQAGKVKEWGNILVFENVER